MNRLPILLGALFVATPLTAQQLPPDSLIVDLDGHPTTLQHSDLESLPHASVTLPAGEGGVHRFTGIPLRAVLERAGFDTAQVYGPALAGSMLVVARDGYRVAFGLSDLDSAITGRALLLAYAMDGAALDARRGPWQLLVPGDLHGRRSVRQVAEIRILRPEP